MGRVHRSDEARLPATDRENCGRVFRGFPLGENAVAVRLLMGRFEIVRVNQIQFGMIIFYNVKISHKCHAMR